MLRLIGAAVVLYVVGFAAFVAFLPRERPAAPHADGIVALTGGDERLKAAVELLENGAGKRLLVTGVNDTTTKAELKKLSNGKVRFDCCADLGYTAEDTHGNAAEAAVWAHRHGYKSLIVVTASYHMPRSLTEFGAAMPGVTLLAYPVEPSGPRGLSMWSTPGMLHLLHSEYLKYLASVVMTRWEKADTNVALDHETRPRKARATS